MINWRKSSYSNGGGQGSCVEVGHDHAGGAVFVRDSKNPDGGSIHIGPAGWRRFLATASRDGFQKR